MGIQAYQSEFEHFPCCEGEEKLWNIATQRSAGWGTVAVVAVLLPPMLEPFSSGLGHRLP